MFFGASLPRASEHHFPPKSALRPGMILASLAPGTVLAGIASHFTSDWLSLFSRERSEPLDNDLSQWILFAWRSRNWPRRRRDWPLRSKDWPPKVTGS